MQNKIIKSGVFSLILILANCSFAECNSVNNYKANLLLNMGNLTINIKDKNNKEFSYYDIKSTNQPYYIGFYLTDPISIKYAQIKDQKNTKKYGLIALSFPKNMSDAEMINVGSFFIGNDKFQFSPALNGIKENETISFPFDKKYIKTTMEYSKIINIEKEISKYHDIYENNNIYGKHKIRFYLNLIESSDLLKCSHFETQDIEYDFGKKPLTKYWSEMFK